MLNGLLPLLIGLTMIIFVKRMGKGWIKWQYLLTKREYPLWSFVIPSVFIGIGFIVIGTIDLFKYFLRK